MENFQIRTESFEGPLDLLLSLIEKRKLHVSDFSLSKIADDFLDHLRALPEISLKETANFVVVASTLMLIKSRSLLPRLALSNEEEGNIEDLKRRLKVYTRVKELSERVKEMFGRQRIFPRGETKEIAPVFSPSKDLTRDALFFAAESVVSNLPKQEKIPQAQVKKMITMEETMSRLIERIQKHMKLRFKDFVGALGGDGKREERAVIIVSFLALLELVKRGVISTEQEGHFEDIQIETREISVPRY